jgi:hypothetical protein
MPRGIVPVVALLIIASAFSQFGGTPPTALLSGAMQASQASPASPAPVSGTEKRPGASPVKNATGELCKDFTPCLPRADLGPWIASCRFVRAQQGSGERSPMVSIDLSRPVSNQLPVIANAKETPNPTLILDDPANSEKNKGRWCLSNAGVPITALVVTLPDPVNSHLALDFDRRVEALQAAALDAQYVLDQFWLPWSVADASPEDAPKTGGERLLRRLRMNQPGLQIFRSRDSNHPSALFVFLVGETPARGVNLPQLENAITYVREVQNAAHQSLTSEIKILGPGFSGSIPLLSEALKRWIHSEAACCFEIIPSSATDHDLLATLGRAVRGAGTAHSVLHDDDAALERFLEYSDQVLKIPPTDVAVVSESQTAYGSGEFTPDEEKNATSRDDDPDSTGRNHAQRPPPSQPPREKLCRYDTGDPKSTLRACTLRLNFPREIYRLRSAYPDPQRLSAGATRSDSAPTSGLTLDLRSSAGREDDIPSFSGQQLPLSQEAIMLSISDTIHRRKIRMVGVFASDVLDMLFVLRFLQEFSPDVRLFVLDSDLLFIRAADNLSLQGSLAVTDYPLSSAVQSWQGDERRLRTFPSRNAEATYNAFLALIGRPERMRDYAPQAAASGLREPLLWLTVVSRDGFQPVHLLERVAGESTPLPFIDRVGEARFRPDLPTGGFLLLSALLLGVTSAQIVLTRLGSNEKVGFLGWALEFFHLCEDSPDRVQKAYLLTTSLLTLAILDFIVVFPIWRITLLGLRHDSIPNWYVAYSILSFAVVAGSLLQAVWLSASHHVFLHKEGIALALSWAIAAGYYFAWIILTVRRGTDSDLFLHRSLDLSNGTSPLLPHLLLFLAFYLWSLTNLRRVHLWETRRQAISLPSLDREYNSACGDLEHTLDGYFKDLFFSKYSWLVLAVVLAILLFSRPFSHIAGFEPFLLGDRRLFDVLYVVYLLLGTALLIGTMVRFVVAWAGLLKVLRRLERQPLRRAFDRLPKTFYSWTPLWHSGGARRTFALQSRALECLRKLQSDLEKSPLLPELKPELKKDLPDLVEDLQDQTSKLLQHEAAGHLDLSDDNRWCQEKMSFIADRLADEFLIPHWEKTGASESLAAPEAKASKGDDGVRYVTYGDAPLGNEPYILAEEFVALRFIAFMRYIGVQLRNLLSFVAAGFILCVASVRSYPFLAHRTIGWSLTLIFIGLSIPVVIAFAQMDKDAILSRLSDTQPGKLDRAFYTRLISYGALPLLTVLASQFPGIGRFLFSWVQPAIAAMH